MRHETRLPADLTSVIRARRWAAEVIGDVPAAPAELVVLVVSELAANAVQHAHTGFSLRIEERPEAIRIEVEDTGAGEPALRMAGPLETSGRGLQIVHDLSDTWGVEQDGTASGKTVWAQFSLPRAGGRPTNAESRLHSAERATTTEGEAASRPPGASGSHRSSSLPLARPAA